MQYKNEKTLQLVKTLGGVINRHRLERNVGTRFHFCNSYELDSSNLRRIEAGEIEAKIAMLWRIAEALNIPLSDLIKEVEDDLGKDFHIIDQ